MLRIVTAVSFTPNSANGAPFQLAAASAAAGKPSRHWKGIGRARGEPAAFN